MECGKYYQIPEGFFPHTVPSISKCRGYFYGCHSLALASFALSSFPILCMFKRMKSNKGC